MSVLWSSRGAQIYGTANVHLPGSDGFDDGMQTYRWQLDAAETGTSVTNPPDTALIQVNAARIVYTNHWLRRSGYAPRQTWTATAPHR